MNKPRSRTAPNALRLIVFLILIIGFSPPFIQSATSSPGATYPLYVDTTVDSMISTGCQDGVIDADCSLRGAISLANLDLGVGNTFVINLPDGEYILNIDLNPSPEDANQEGDLDILNPNLILQGTSQNGTIIDGNNTDRVIDLLGYETSLTVNDLTIQHGRLATGTGGGGGIRVTAVNQLTTNRVTINDNVVSGSAANDQGGGIYGYSGASLMILDTLIRHNNAYKGGGIATSNNTLQISDSVIDLNYSSDIGGGIGITNGGTTNIERTLFDDNEGTRGGGFFNSGGASLTVTDSTFQDNASNSTGGGLELYGTSSLINVTISGNESESSGGGIALREGSSASLTNVTLVDNASLLGNGGGINLSTSSNLSLNHVTFAENRSYYPGNAIFANADSIGSTVSSIFTDAAAGDTCAINTASWTSSFYNLSSDASCGLVPGLDLVNTNPQFGTFGDHGGFTFTLPILPNSPAIDHGKPGDPVNRLDQRGAPILDGDGNGSLLSDIGAYEFVPPCIWLPLVVRP